MTQQAVWRELLERFLQFVGVVIEASQIFIFCFLHNKQHKDFKTIGAYTESTDLIFKTFNKIIHLVTQSFLPFSVFILYV